MGESLSSTDVFETNNNDIINNNNEDEEKIEDKDERESTVSAESGRLRKSGQKSPEVVENVVRRVETILSSRDSRHGKKDSKPRGRSPKRKRRRSTRNSPSYSSRSSSSRSTNYDHRRKSPVRKRSTSSSSRGTYDDFEVFLDEKDCPFSCKTCRRGFYTIKELAEHEIRAHDAKIPCAHCEKVAESVTKLAAHILFRHPTKSSACYFCGTSFGQKSDVMDRKQWEEFRNHVYKEVLKKKMYEHSSRASGASTDAVALRGVGKCPHGTPIKCKNFPNCPGAKCIYSHGQCRYDITCNKATCPFDHSNKPRVCMACVNEIKGRRKN